MKIRFALLFCLLLSFQTAMFAKDAKDLDRTPDFLVHDSRNPDVWIKKYSDQIKKNPGDFVSYYHRGRCYMDSKENEKAISDFNTSIKLNPRSKTSKEPISEFDDARTYLSFCYQHLALIYLAQKLYQKAIDAASTAIKLRPDYAMNWRTRAMAYTKLGKKTLAQTDFQRAYTLVHSPLEGY